MVASVPRWENSRQCDDEVEHEKRLLVLVRLTSASARDRTGVERLHIRSPRLGSKYVLAAPWLLGQNVPSRRHDRGLVGRSLRHMGVRRHFGEQQRVVFLAAALAQDHIPTDVRRSPTLQIGQREGLYPVAAVSSAQKGEQRLVLVDREQLSVAIRPALGSEAEGHDADLAEKG